MQSATLFFLLSTIAPIFSSRILYLAPANITSHHMWNTVLVNKLAEKGHHLTYIAAMPDRGKPHPNIEYHVREQSEKYLKASVEARRISLFGSSLEKARVLYPLLLFGCEEMLKTPLYQNLSDPKNNATYDLIIMEYDGFDCLLPLTQRFGSPPVIFTQPLTTNPHLLLRIAGVPVFPMVPHILSHDAEPMGIWDRLKTYLFYLHDDYNYFTGVQPEMEKINRKYFGEHVLPLKQYFEKVALSLVNIPEWMNKIPLTPNIIPVAGIHLTKPKPLSSNLQKFMDNAKDGVILISFGTVIPTQYLSVATFGSMASALGEVPQKVLWKWDPHMSDDGIVFPENVLRLSWIPQNDVLGHPNTRLFVSHCGGQSTIEAVFHGVPILAVPGFFDQHNNADRLVAENAALRLNFNEITQENFLKSILELLENRKYAEGILKLKISLREQPTKPLDRAIFWIEYVIRNKGAPHLRPLLHKLSNNHVLVLDIVLATSASVIIVAVVLVSLMSVLRNIKQTFDKSIKNKAD